MLCPGHPFVRKPCAHFSQLYLPGSGTFGVRSAETAARRLGLRCWWSSITGPRLESTRTREYTATPTPTQAPETCFLPLSADSPVSHTRPSPTLECTSDGYPWPCSHCIALPAHTHSHTDYVHSIPLDARLRVRGTLRYCTLSDLQPTLPGIRLSIRCLRSIGSLWKTPFQCN